MPDLMALGWNDEWEAEFGVYRAQGLLPARVCLEHNHIYRVVADAGEYLAEAAGRIKYEASGRRELPAVGDWVAIRVDPAGERVTIRAVLTRRSWFSRRAAGRVTEEQVIAANVDLVLVVFGLDIHVKPRAIERYLALAATSRAAAAVVLNKVDLAEDPGAAIAEARRVAGEAPVYAVSAKSGEGLGAVAACLRPGRTIALLGPSGSGKSSIVNRLVGDERQATQDVRERDARGRHTSVHRQLLFAPLGGMVIDTPGMRELQLWDASESLDEAFAEVAAAAPACRFRDCLHEHEPGCAVKAAVEAGQISEDRYAAYLSLAAEQRDANDARAEYALVERRRLGKVQSKALKAMQKGRGR